MGGYRAEISLDACCRFSIYTYRQLEEQYRKFSNVVLAHVAACNYLQFFSVESLGLKLLFKIHIFFSTAVLRKLFHVRFSYKHYNFSRGCLLRDKNKTVMYKAY